MVNTIMILPFSVLVTSTVVLASCVHWASAEFFTLGYAGYLAGTAIMSGAWYNWDKVKDNTYCKFTECCNSHYIPYHTDGTTTMTWSPISVVVYSIGVVLCLGAADGSWYKWDSLIDNTFCKLMECCNSDSIPYDIRALRYALSKRMIGQPLVAQLANILAAHKASLNDENKNRKAEVISLHGWTGVGKNFAASMIADSLYTKGTESSFVRVYQGQKAIDSGNISASRARLYNEIRSIVKRCPTSLFIFDEVDEMDPGILDRIKPMLDFHRSVDGVDYRKAVFIFISNIGGQNITDVLLDLYNSGLKREEVGLHHFEPVIRRMAFNIGGFSKAAIIANHLIDHYIPFLPLEQQHVEQCARAEFAYNGVPHPTDEMMKEGLNVITYGPKQKPIFSNNGCKRFAKHIPFVIEKHRQAKRPSGEF